MKIFVQSQQPSSKKYCLMQHYFASPKSQISQQLCQHLEKFPIPAQENIAITSKETPD